MGIVVHLDPCTINCRKVLAGLDLLGVDYETKHVDYFKSEQKSDAFKKINPMATLPVAVVDEGELAITESNAILLYAAGLSQSSSSVTYSNSASGADETAATTAYPQDLNQRAKVHCWLLWEASQWFPSCYVYVIENVVKPNLLGLSPDSAALASEQERFDKLTGVLDAALSKSRFLVGDAVTIADIAVAAPMHLWRQSKLRLEERKNVLRWIGEIEDLSCWKKTSAAVISALCPSEV